MFKAISNTSPLLYLYRIGVIELLPQLFNEILTPETVRDELYTGRVIRACGYLPKSCNESSNWQTNLEVNSKPVITSQTPPPALSCR